MKRIILTLFLTFCFVIGAFLISVNKSMAQGKPTVLLISASMCGACKQFEPTYNAAKAKFSQKFNFVKEDVSHSQKAKELGVTETPTVFILENNKAEKIGWECLSNPGCFEQKLQNY